MSDKVQLIKQEIERLDEEYRILRVEGTIQQAKEADLVVHVLQKLGNFIDFLPKEHNEDLEEEIDRCYKSRNDLMMTRKQFRELIHHFAEWQKQKDQETIELAEEHAMLAGMDKMKEKMMKDAVDATILDVDAQTIEFGLWPEKLLDIKEGDKVKIIILKTEQQ